MYLEEHARIFCLEPSHFVQERVKVAEPLPLLNGTVQIQNGSRSLQEENTVSDELDKPPLPLSIAALKGQILNLNLMIKNIGEGPPYQNPNLFCNLKKSVSKELFNCLEPRRK